MDASGDAFRFVHFPVAADDFDPPAVRNKPMPPRGCGDWALSMFVSTATAQEFHRKLRQLPNPNIVKKIGDHLAVGKLQPAFGRATKPTKNGHFDLFEYSNSNIAAAFSVIGRIT